METSLFMHSLKPLAYLDPGTGSFLIQTLIAILASSIVVIGIYWRKVKNWFKKISGKEPGYVEADLENDDDV